MPFQAIGAIASLGEATDCHWIGHVWFSFVLRVFDSEASRVNKSFEASRGLPSCPLEMLFLGVVPASFGSVLGELES